MFLTSSQMQQLQRYDVTIHSQVNIYGDLITGKHIEIFSETSNKGCSNIYIVNSRIGSYTILNPGEYKTLFIGNYSTVGEGFKTLGKHDYTRITTHGCTYLNHQSVQNFKNKSYFHPFASVFLGHNVWLGCNVIVKQGLMIGHGAVVEDGAVVTKNVPPFAIVAGSPARIIGLRYPKDIVERMLKCMWFSYDWQGIPLDWTELEVCLSEMERYIKAQQVPLLNQGAVAFQLSKDSTFADATWTLDDFLKLYFKTSDFRQILALPEIKHHSLQF